MEISVVEKISLEERVSLLSQEVESKKNIISGLRKEIERVGQKDCDLLIKEKEILKRGRDMQKYEEEFQSYYEKNERKFKSQIDNLER